jgi:hypothetical protein
MNSLKEEIFPIESFIGGWYIPEKLCDDIISYFNNNQDKCCEGTLGKNYMDKSFKESTDLYIKYNDEQVPFNYYKNFLEQIIHLYEKKYEVLKRQKAYNVVNNYQIQYYKPNQGFKKWHCERMDDVNRNLVFMTYLNDVKDGGTEFKYQNIITPAKKGLTLIWPTDFTHTHKGQISKTSEKYIITGWMGYL